MSGKSIAIKAQDGGSFSGYLATPASASGPGILVIQAKEPPGIHSHMRHLLRGKLPAT